MMNCQEFTLLIDDYLDGSLDNNQIVSIEKHITECNSCHEKLSQAQDLLNGLKNIPVPEMSPGFAQRAIRQATEQKQPNEHHRRGFITGFSSAIAAGLVLVLVVGGLLPTQQPDQLPMQTASVHEPIQEITLSVEQVQMVNLVFDAPHAVADAELSLTLPPHVELSGYPGQHNLAWRSEIKQGRNVLSLPIRGIAKADGELIAQINSNGKVKSIRIQLHVDDNGIPHAVINHSSNNLS